MPRSLLVFDAEILFVSGEAKLLPDAMEILTLEGVSKFFVSVDDPKIERSRSSILQSGKWFDGHCIANHSDFRIDILRNLINLFHEQERVSQLFFVRQHSRTTLQLTVQDFSPERPVSGEPVLLYDVASLSEASHIITQAVDSL